MMPEQFVEGDQVLVFGLGRTPTLHTVANAMPYHDIPGYVMLDDGCWYSARVVRALNSAFVGRGVTHPADRTAAPAVPDVNRFAKPLQSFARSEQGKKLAGSLIGVLFDYLMSRWLSRQVIKHFQLGDSKGRRRLLTYGWYMILTINRSTFKLVQR